VQFLDVNLLAIFAAAVANIILGIIWYSPALFGNAWTNLAGKRKEELHRGTIEYAGSFLAAFAAAYVLAMLVEATQSNSIESGAFLGLIAGLGLIATSTAVNFMFEKRPMGLYLITVGYHIVAYTFMGAILGNLS
jgi:surface polysaccharide O-acyltransferase-like enzyme